MTPVMIKPGQKIGVLGGGQLGMFFAVTAKRMGYPVVVWDPDVNAPARSCADLFIGAPFDDVAAYRAFLKETCAVTYEWENIPPNLADAIEVEVPLRPTSRVLRLLQNRVLQKQFLSERGLPVTPFWTFDDPATLPTLPLDFPAVCKTATGGYDGHGQFRLNRTQDAAALAQTLRSHPSFFRKTSSARWVVEQWVPHLKELSLILACDSEGRIIPYPISENVHERGILRTSQTPADINPALARRATSLASDAVAALQSAGVFCVELFLLPDGALCINEIAPRPHNSGHYSMDAATVSQFEQQVRVLCGLPIIAPKLLSCAVMVNILGHEIDTLQSHTKELFSLPGARVYHYRKQTVKAGRKMGHITLLDSDPQVAMQQAEKVRRLLDPVNRSDSPPPVS